MQPAASSGLAIDVAARPTAEIGDFDAVVRQYWPRVFRFALASLRDRDGAESVAQDCFLKAWQARERFRGDCGLQTWLMQIAVNLVRDRVRSRRLQFWKSAVEIDSVSQWIPDGSLSPEAQAAGREQIAAVWQATAKLSGEAADRVPAAVCGRDGIARDRRRHRHERGNGENSPLPGARSGSQAIGEAQMNSHLSPEQISRWMMGERTPLEEQHVRECQLCAAEVAGFQSALAAFRGSVREWSDQQIAMKPVRPALRTRPLRWAWIAATLVTVGRDPDIPGGSATESRASQGGCGAVGTGGCAGIARDRRSHGAPGEIDDVG